MISISAEFWAFFPNFPFCLSHRLQVAPVLYILDPFYNSNTAHTCSFHPLAKYVPHPPHPRLPSLYPKPYINRFLSFPLAISSTNVFLLWVTDLMAASHQYVYLSFFSSNRSLFCFLSLSPLSLFSYLSPSFSVYSFSL